jgi:hypothetical protein
MNSTIQNSLIGALDKLLYSNVHRLFPRPCCPKGPWTAHFTPISKQLHVSLSNRACLGQYTLLQILNKALLSYRSFVNSLYSNHDTYMIHTSILIPFEGYFPRMLETSRFDPLNNSRFDISNINGENGPFRNS